MPHAMPVHDRYLDVGVRLILGDIPPDMEARPAEDEVKIGF